ncbi:MAG: peptide ABC transporter substrate-binding protein, partial [Anaerolineales bacterium]|nr:peptide ABC transporter substrate-binding protein [Anaerolineales bacterium]
MRPTLEAKPPARLGATLNLPGGEPPTLDPALTQDATSATYIVEIFSGLVTLNRDLEIVPDIAESWELSDDGMTYTFHLRNDVKFHDGKPVTAQDFKYSIERACD